MRQKQRGFNATLKLFSSIAKIIAPPPELKISEWADRYRQLSQEASAEHGQWSTDRVPYLREIMDSVNDPTLERIIFLKSSQVAGTELLLNIIGYHIDYDPAPILVIQPNVKPMAEDFSKDRLAPMLRDTPALRGKVKDSKGKDSGNTILHKSFPGGHITMVGTNASAGLASRPIRIVLADEVDRYADSAGCEGDPVSLAAKRTITFWNRKIVLVSTPTIKGISKIEREYNLGTKESWRIKCPGCDQYHYLKFPDIRFEYEKKEIGKEITYLVQSVAWKCPNCLDLFPEHLMKQQPGKWVAENPEALKNGIRSFKINALVSPWMSWIQIVQEFLTSKDDPELRKVFINTILGESYEERGEIEDETILLERREDYESELPDGVLLLTASVDTQDDRLEYEVVGWGHGEECWGIEKRVIWGKPDDVEVWKELDQRIFREFKFANSTGLLISCVFIDSGGHYTDEVYAYCKRRQSKRVFAIKGQGGSGIPILHKISRNNKANIPLLMIGVDSAKTTVISRIKIKQPGIKYFHWPKDEKRGYDQQYFKGLIAEKQVQKKEKGKIVLRWENVSSDKRNEPLDLRVYNLAALRLLAPNFDLLEQKIRGITPTNTQKTQQKAPQRPRGVVKKGVNY